MHAVLATLQEQNKFQGEGQEPAQSMLQQVQVVVQLLQHVCVSAGRTGQAWLSPSQHAPAQSSRCRWSQWPPLHAELKHLQPQTVLREMGSQPRAGSCSRRSWLGCMQLMQPPLVQAEEAGLAQQASLQR